MSGDWLKARVGLTGPGGISWDDLSELVKIAQEELDVSADGKPGAKTMAALRDRLGIELCPAPPTPKTRAGVKRAFGNPKWTKLPRGRAVDIDDEWERRNVRWFRLHTGKRVRFHRLLGDKLVRVFELACEASGYTPKSVQTYVPRVIGGTSNLSMHAYAIAFDVDPAANPWSGRQKDGSLSKLRQHPDFVRVFEENGFGWGGRWSHKGKKGWGDAMHFEYGASRDYAGEPIKGVEE